LRLKNRKDFPKKKEKGKNRKGKEMVGEGWTVTSKMVKCYYEHLHRLVAKEILCGRV
jgi:hypothetical protein